MKPTHCDTCTRMFQTADEHTGILAQAQQDWLRKEVVQTRVANPEYKDKIGRRGTVTAVMVDERNIVQVQTDDRVWCPAWLLERQ